jgi:hypothetical protein
VQAFSTGLAPLLVYFSSAFIPMLGPFIGIALPCIVPVMLGMPTVIVAGLDASAREQVPHR